MVMDGAGQRDLGVAADGMVGRDKPDAVTIHDRHQKLA
jgi:hypothetical protein